MNILNETKGARCPYCWKEDKTVVYRGYCTKLDHVMPSPNVAVQNRRGEWVLTIEEPYWLHPFFLDRCQCRCGRKFWSKEGYQAHYALKHILAL